MKRTAFRLIVLFFFSNVCFAQESIDKDALVGFGCFYEGTQSKTVEKVTKKLKNRNYKAISKMLVSENNAERYMAVITLENLVVLEMYVLTTTERKMIEEIKQSNELVSVCSGCMYFAEVSLNEIFSEENSLFAQNWLNSNFPKK